MRSLHTRSEGVGRRPTSQSAFSKRTGFATKRPSKRRRGTRGVCSSLALGGLAVIVVLALTGADARATSEGGAAAACSNQAATVVGKPTTLRFVLHGVSCSEAHRLIRRYFRAVTPQSCATRGTICLFEFPGGWSCSFIFAGEGPGTAGCFQARTRHSFKVFALARSIPAPRQHFFTTAGTLHGVTAIAAGDAWAVGSSGNHKSLILHWNGHAWRQVPSPSPGATNYLNAVAATSASDAWAVGNSGLGPLILHWDGIAWSQVPSPSPGANDSLNAVAATSASDAWAVGSTGPKTLILHWDGTSWTQVPSPLGGSLDAVGAASGRNAWAVGITTRGHALTVRWNGTAWRQVPSPSPSAGSGLADVLAGVAVMSTSNAWAVGSSGCGCGPGKSLIERWNGHSWKRISSPTLGHGTELSGVVGVSGHGAWAVGASGEGDSPTTTVILHWHGSVWRRVPSPSPGASAYLSSVTAVSARGAWAVGGTSNRSRTKFSTLILRWNGTAWQ